MLSFLEVVIDPLGGQVRGGPHRLPHGRLGLPLLRNNVLARHEVLDEVADVVACIEENRCVRGQRESVCARGM